MSTETGNGLAVPMLIVAATGEASKTRPVTVTLAAVVAATVPSAGESMKTSGANESTLIVIPSVPVLGTSAASRALAVIATPLPSATGTVAVNVYGPLPVTWAGWPLTSTVTGVSSATVPRTSTVGPEIQPPEVGLVMCTTGA